MDIPFTKYQGTGNDFILIDQRREKFLSQHDHKVIQRMCDRKFGIGADGLIILATNAMYDYEMIYYNADGRTSSMCGNGGRCITAFANQVGLAPKEYRFLAIDGEHISKFNSDGTISLMMSNVSDYHIGDGYYILDTGSPHYIIFVEDIDDIDVKEQGQSIRYSSEFKAEGINVNFVEVVDGKLIVATYERGVEDETLSCGTGVTAAALAYALHSKLDTGEHTIEIQTKGGLLEVKFSINSNSEFENIWLSGSATKVFKGVYSTNYL